LENGRDCSPVFLQILRNPYEPLVHEGLSGADSVYELLSDEKGIGLL
jgi:hypothetical protein